MANRLRTTLAALTFAIAAAAALLWGWPEARAEGNSAPVIGEPASTSLKYLFPRGEKAVLDFSSEPVTDADSDPTTVRFVFAVPNTSTTDNLVDTRWVGPGRALFKITRNGHDFEFTAKDGVTPSEWTALYGDGLGQFVQILMYANDGTEDSDHLSTIMTVYHDASPQFDLAATHQDSQRWKLDREITVYEGATANAELASIILGEYDENGDANQGLPPPASTPTGTCCRYHGQPATPGSARGTAATGTAPSTGPE